MMLRIRDADDDDCEFLAQGNSAMAHETEHKTLDPQTVRSGVAHALADPAHGRYFIAEDATGARVGQLMITCEWSDWRNGQFWWIQSVYVLASARRLGVFRALYDHVERLAQATPGVCGLRLYVESDNVDAQRTYARCGMVDAGYRVMETEFSTRAKSRTGG